MGKEFNLTFQKKTHWHTIIASMIAVPALGLDHNHEKNRERGVKRSYILLTRGYLCFYKLLHLITFRL